MVLLGCVILPHGALPFDGDPNSQSEACRQRHAKLDPKLAPAFKRLYDGCCDAAQLVSDMDPEVIVLHTPHGITLSESTGVYFNTAAAGNAEWVGHWKEFEVTVDCATGVAHGIVNHLKAHGCAAQGITGYSNLNTVPLLRWGEAIPTWYLTQALGEGAKDVKFVFMTSPRPQTPSDYLKTVHKGGILYEYLEQQKERIVFAVSGDLSHTYETSCEDQIYLPDPSSSMPVDNNTANKFERDIKSWALGQQEGCSETTWNPERAEPFLQQCSDLQAKALSCGIGGFILLHGLMNACLEAGGSILLPTLTTCEAPTYYGMMAVVYNRIKSA